MPNGLLCVTGPAPRRLFMKVPVVPPWIRGSCKRAPKGCPRRAEVHAEGTSPICIPGARGAVAPSRRKRRDGFCGNGGDVLHNGQDDMTVHLGVLRLARTDMHITSGLPAETVATSSMGWNEPVPNQPSKGTLRFIPHSVPGTVGAGCGTNRSVPMAGADPRASRRESRCEARAARATTARRRPVRPSGCGRLPRRVPRRSCRRPPRRCARRCR